MIRSACCCKACQQEDISGNYDANVLMMALSSKKVEVQFWDSRKKDVGEIIHRVKKDDCVGLILNTSGAQRKDPDTCKSWILRMVFGEVGHWIAVRKEKDQFCNLNSKYDEPEIYRNDDELANFLEEQLERDIHILIATSMEPGKG